MCGFAGFAEAGGNIDRESCETRLRKMGEAIVHRGPDAGGVWLNDALSVGLSHRRLSILDLSPLGAQPMASASGRFVIAFNGEIYNFQALGEELAADGAYFRGHSDTEVMLAAFEAWGVEAALGRFAGDHRGHLNWQRRVLVLHRRIDVPGQLSARRQNKIGRWRSLKMSP